MNSKLSNANNSQTVASVLSAAENPLPPLLLTRITRLSKVYFPIQNVLKIKFSTSSAVVCPVSESSAHNAR